MALGQMVLSVCAEPRMHWAYNQHLPWVVVHCNVTHNWRIVARRACSAGCNILASVAGATVFLVGRRYVLSSNAR